MFIVRETLITKLFGAGVVISLEDDATMLDAIAKADEIISKRGSFPYSEYKTLLHMVYNPVEDRFYEQVGVHTYTPGKFYNIRNSVRHELLDGMTIILIPNAGCISDFEEPLNYEEFAEALKKYNRIKSIDIGSFLTTKYR